MSKNREALEAAFDEAESEPVDPGTQVAPDPIVEAEPVIEAEPIIEAEAPAETGTDPIIEPVAEQENMTAGLEPDAPTGVKPPASWTPEARETWAGVPPAAQAEIMRREKEIGVALTNTGEARKHYEEFNNIVTPFNALMAAEGATPMQAVQTLLGTAATLQTGTQQAKAQRIAGLITHYGVDLQTLDSLLAGQAPQQQQPNQQFEQMFEQRMAPINQFLQQQQNQQQQYQQQQQQEATTEWTAFRDSHEFAPDLQMQMADLIEVAARNGREMTLDQAYETTIMSNPNIRQIVDQRKVAANAGQGMQGKEKAAVSLAGGGAMMAGTPVPGSRREALEQAFDS